MLARIDQSMCHGLVELWMAKDGCPQKLPGNRSNKPRSGRQLFTNVQRRQLEMSKKGRQTPAVHEILFFFALFCVEERLSK